MPIENRPIETVFASTAPAPEVINFPDWGRGWGLTFDPGQTEGVPPMEWFNSAFQTINKAVRYLVQRGISEWTVTETYPQHGLCLRNGSFYRALIATTGQDPETTPLAWKKTLLEASDLGTMAVQNANAVAITGGTAELSSLKVAQQVTAAVFPTVLENTSTNAASGTALYLHRGVGGVNGRAGIAYVPGSYLSIGTFANDSLANIVFSANGSVHTTVKAGGAWLLGPVTDTGADRLQVAGSGLFTLHVRSNSYVAAGSAGAGTGGQFRSYDDGGTLRWLSGILGQVGARNYSVYNAATSSPVLTIAENGNAVFGVGAPNENKLSVDGNIWQGNGLGVEIGKIFNEAGWYTLLGSSTVTGVTVAHSNTVRFATGGLERARFDSAGNFGLSVTPNSWGGTYKAVQIGPVGSVAATSSVIYLGANWYQDPGGTNRFITDRKAAIIGVDYDANITFTRSTSAGAAGSVITFAESMRIDSQGNVGIGGSPTERLYVNGNISAVSSVGYNSSASRFLQLGALNADSVNSTAAYSWQLFVGGNAGGQALAFQALIRDVGTVERMRISGAGNLLIGTATDNGADKLQVAGTAYASSAFKSIAFIAAASGASGAFVADGDGPYFDSTGGYRFFSNGGRVFTIGGGGSIAVGSVAGYSGANSAITARYTGGGTQFGMTLGVSATNDNADSVAINFLREATTSAVGSIVQFAGGTGLKLSGAAGIWQVETPPLGSNGQQIVSANWVNNQGFAKNDTAITAIAPPDANRSTRVPTTQWVANNFPKTGSYAGNNLSQSNINGTITKTARIALGDIPSGGSSGTFNWPTAFPNGVETCQLTVLDSSGNRNVFGGLVSYSTSGFTWWVNENSAQNQSITLEVFAMGN